MTVRISFLMLMLFCATKLFSQRVLDYIKPFDVDTYLYEINPAIAKAKVFTKKTYHCNGCAQDSCKLTELAVFNDSGKLIKLQVGENLDAGKIACTTVYRQLSDSTVEAIAKYPPGSTEIPREFFLDTVINGKLKRLSLYKVDKDKTLSVRSIYLFNNSPIVQNVKRFDADNKLIHAYYPFGSSGSQSAKSETIDTTVTMFDSTIRYRDLFTDSETELTVVYTRHGELKHVTEFNRHFESNYKLFTITSVLNIIRT